MPINQSPTDAQIKAKAEADAKARAAGQPASVPPVRPGVNPTLAPNPVPGQGVPSTRSANDPNFPQNLQNPAESVPSTRSVNDPNFLPKPGDTLNPSGLRETINPRTGQVTKEVAGDPLKYRVVDPRDPSKTIEQTIDALGAGQQYFEAPDGTVMIGEADKTQLWYRKGNDGKGMWINPMSKRRVDDIVAALLAKPAVKPIVQPTVAPKPVVNPAVPVR